MAVKKLKGFTHKHAVKGNGPDVVILDHSCIHGLPRCSSQCQFFDEERCSDGFKAVLYCTGIPVTIMVDCSEKSKL